MKNKFYFVVIIVSLPVFSAYSQGSFVYDQQSSTDASSAGGGAIIQNIASPYGQSFTPSLSSIGFIQLGLYDDRPNNSLGATVFINLREDSISGTIIGSTEPVSMPDGFGESASGIATFYFATPVTIISGTTYYFQPVVQSGDLWGVSAGEYNYPGGMVFVNGEPASGSDYWFREGIVVPEPLPSWLVLLGGGIFLYARRTFHR